MVALYFPRKLYKQENMIKNAVIVMTSNLGSHMIMQMAGQDGELIREAVMAEVKGHFRPEFLAACRAESPRAALARAPFPSGPAPGPQPGGRP